MPIPQEEIIVAFRNRFGNYGLYQNEEYMGYKDVFQEVESFLRSSLTSQAQGLVKELLTVVASCHGKTEAAEASEGVSDVRSALLEWAKSKNLV